MKGNLQEIIYDNRNLIYSIVHRFGGNDFDDLFQAGCLGLIKAYQSFNDNYDVKFTTYAYPFIVGEIYKYLCNNKNIRMSPMNMKLISSIRKGEEALTNHLGRSPTDTELAAFLEIDLYKLSELRNLVNIESLDYQYEQNDLYDFVSSKNLSIDSLIDLKDALISLNDEERKIINARYFYNLTQSEVAKLYHTNQVKISRDEQKILTKLKAKMY